LDPPAVQYPVPDLAKAMALANWRAAGGCGDLGALP
jgi:hypothetical protein